MSLVGNLEDLGLRDILQIVSLSCKSGVLLLQSRNREGEIVFFHGQVIHAVSSVFPENFGNLLVRRNIVDVETLNGALALQRVLPKPALLGVILGQNFGISADLVESVAREQIKRVVYSFFGWSDGTFAFELEDPDTLAAIKLSPYQRILQQGLNTQWLAIEGSRILDEQRHRGPASDFSAEAISAFPAVKSDVPEALSDTTRSYDFAADLLAEIGERGVVAGEKSAIKLGGLKQLQGMFLELNNPSLGGGIILLVLRFASEFMNRAVIFWVKEKEIVGLGQFDIEFGDESADVRIRKMRIPVDEPSIFNSLLADKISQRVRFDNCHWDNYLKENLGAENASEIFLAPLVSGGQVVAILYGDNLPQRTPVGETEALEIFLSHAGLTMEKALLERRLQERAKDK
jgi:Domain of unknown function (DUF4388)